MRLDPSWRNRTGNRLTSARAGQFAIGIRERITSISERKEETFVDVPVQVAREILKRIMDISQERIFDRAVPVQIEGHL